MPEGWNPEQWESPWHLKTKVIVVCRQGWVCSMILPIPSARPDAFPGVALCLGQVWDQCPIFSRMMVWMPLSVCDTHTQFILFYNTYVYICVYIYMLAYAHVSQKRASDFPGAAITSSWKPSHIFLVSISFMLKSLKMHALGWVSRIRPNEEHSMPVPMWQCILKSEKQSEKWEYVQLILMRRLISCLCSEFSMGVCYAKWWLSNYAANWLVLKCSHLHTGNNRVH